MNQRAIVFPVAGVSFAADYPDNLHQLCAIISGADQAFHAMTGRAVDPFDPDAGAERPAVILVREPDNKFDANAIAVHVPITGSDSPIGHVPRDIAARLAPSLDNGDTWQAELISVAVHQDHTERPGARVRIRKIEGPKPCPTETHTV